MRWLLLLFLFAGPVWADHFKREHYVQAEVVALRETLWTLSEAADRGDVPATKALVCLAWKQWLDIDRDLRDDIKYAYPRTERQFDNLEAEAVGRAQQLFQAQNPPVTDLPPTRVDVRYPGYSDEFDLFGNSGLGRLP